LSVGFIFLAGNSSGASRFSLVFPFIAWQEKPVPKY
jgi:hypothetical protein